MPNSLKAAHAVDDRRALLDKPLTHAMHAQLALLLQALDDDFILHLSQRRVDGRFALFAIDGSTLVAPAPCAHQG